MSEDLYDLLGVGRAADEKALKSAYRKAAMKWHPDKNPGDAEAEKKFKKVTQAYEILGDPQKRAVYDRHGMAAFAQGGPGGGAGGFGGADFADVFNDIFGDFMGGRQRRRGGPRRGSDLRYDLQIDLEDAYAGKTAEVKATTRVTCEVCGGTGAAEGSSLETCRTCGGAGRIRATQGFFTMERTCHVCQGEGQVVSDPCRACGGQGRVDKERTLGIQIPPGVDDGTRIRLAGEGEAGPKGGPAGDLYVFLSVRPHEIFERDGMDLFCAAPVGMAEAALGGEVEVPIIDGGRSRVKLSPGVQSGKRYRLKGKGMPSIQGGPMGDLYVELMVETPVNLTERQKELLREFAEAGGDNSPGASSFLRRAKAFWDSVKPNA